MSISKQINSELEGLVKGFDWSYVMSDSHDVWEVGVGVERSIKAKIHALCAIHREDSESLYSEIKNIAGEDYTDYDSSGYGLKYRTIHSWFKPYIGE